MNVTVAEVLAGAAAHEVPLTAECVGYLVLGAADQIAGAPRSVGAGDLLLSEEGVVRIAGGRAAAALEAERDLRGMLDALLVRASAASPGLLRASRRPPGAGIEGLVRELETALIPVNRSAAKRSLARLQRETRRAVESGRVRTDAPPPRPSEPASSVPVPAPAAVASVALPAPFEAVVVSTRAAFAEPLVETTVVPPAVLTEPLPPASDDPVARDEQPEHTVMLAPAAPPPAAAPVEPSQAETRPEPVVLRASSRPTAPAPAPSFVEGGHTEPLPLVTIPPAAPLPRNLFATPLLGTLVAPHEDVPPAAAAPDVCDFEILVESEALPEAHVDGSDVFAEHEVRTAVSPPEALAAPDSGEFTLPCPPLAADSMLPPLVEMLEAATASFEAESVLGADDMITPDDIVEVSDGFEPEGYVPLAEPYVAGAEPYVGEAEACVGEAEACVGEAEPYVGEAEPHVAEAEPNVAEAEPNVAEAEPHVAEAEPHVAPVPEPPPPSEIGLAVAVESELPPWVRSVPAAVYESAPPPRVALPAPRQSDIEDLLMRLEEAPLSVDELRSGLKHLAGMEPTPAPPAAFGASDARKAPR